VLRLDHLFVSPSVEVTDAGPVRTRLSRVASDHFPLLAEVRLTGTAGLGATVDDLAATPLV
jgi:endonuclease/exonuclease/phosphatase family metal-dependent hydrolase